MAPDDLITARAGVKSLGDEVSARLQAVLDAKAAVSAAQQRRDASAGWWAWITGRRPAAEAALRNAQAAELSARTLWNTSHTSHEAAEKALALMEESWRHERTRLQEQRRNQRQDAEQRLAWIEACAATLQTRPLLARRGFSAIEDETRLLISAQAVSQADAHQLVPSPRRRPQPPRISGPRPR